MSVDRDHSSWRGAGSGSMAEAMDFAREIAADWGERVVIRIGVHRDGGRRTIPGDYLLWDVYAVSP